MKLTKLQRKVLDRARREYDGNICIDLFKPGGTLCDDVKIRRCGVAAAAQALIDDSMYWDGSWL